MNQTTNSTEANPWDQRQSILVVDDDPLNLSIMEEILSDRYDLIYATDGVEALERINDADVSLVLLDVMMPEMDGYEACQRIKESLIGPTTQVILVSARASTADRVKGYEVGADDYLTKPFEEDELLAKVQVHLRLRNALVQLARGRDETLRDNLRLENVVERQSNELMDTRDLLVFAMAKLTDSRDPETGAHLERIRAYSEILARELSEEGPYSDIVDEDFIDDIYRSSPLHDVGKVGIPDVILLKPGRLSNAEFEIMKRHSAIGAKALAEVAQHDDAGRFLAMAVEIARHHHERFDGSGYPSGMAGTDIPLSARIVALADVFDALTSVRVYKEAFSVDVARSMIEQESGCHFDPVVVDAFIKKFDEIVKAREKFSDDEAHREAA